METLTRTGLAVPSADKSDAVHPVAHLRAIGQAFNDQGVIFLQGTLAARPTAGTEGLVYFVDSGAGAGVLWWDDGAAWAQVGVIPATDAAANVGSLRTLGAGAQQAAAGNHGHGTAAITGLDTTLADLQAQIAALTTPIGVQIVTRTGDAFTGTNADDDTLLLPVAASASYVVTARLHYNAADGSRYLRLYGPTGTTGSADWTHSSGGAPTTNTIDATTTTSGAMLLTSGTAYYDITGTVATSGTSGYLHLRAPSGGVTLKTSAFLRLSRFA